MPKPRVFVSSTCFDLGQVRDELSRFIEREVGYDAVLSEHPSFPVNPDKTTVENSQLAVKNSADIFVLIIGGRYGSIDEKSGKSITNSEFVEARAKGIPIYIFVLKAIEILHPTWLADPDHFTHPTVESPLVFDFLRYVKSTARWLFPFEKATDIIDTLRIQWAYLQFEGLETRALLAPLDELRQSGLSGQALDIAVRKPQFWEYMLFQALLEEELKSREAMKRDLELRFVLKHERHFTDLKQAVDWMGSHVRSAQLIASRFETIVEEIMSAFGPPGQAGDAGRIAYSCSRLGQLYEATLGWALELHKTSVPDEATSLFEAASHLMDDVVHSFERFAGQFTALLDEAKAGRTMSTVVMTWTVRVPDAALERFNDELKRLSAPQTP